MGHALRYRDESELPESVRKRLAKRFQDKPAQTTPAPSPSPSPAPRARKPRRDEEHQQQANLFLRLAALAINDPRFAQAVRRTHAIPNGGGRSKAEGGRLKAEGVRKGVPDIFCAMPQGSFHGLYIEMKSADGRVSDEQTTWLDESRALGYAGAVCRSADEAFDLWHTYNGRCEMLPQAPKAKP